MMKRHLLYAALLSASLSLTAYANNDQEISPLPLFSKEQLSNWLQDDPALQEAQSRWERDRSQAEITRRSPHEWTATYTHQEREYRAPDSTGDNTSTEWNLAVERGVQWPGKGRAKAREAAAMVDAGEAERIARTRALIRDFIEHYTAYAGAAATLAIYQREYGVARENSEAVSKRVRAGDAPALEYRLATAELQMLEQEVAAAEQDAATRERAFATRYRVAYDALMSPSSQPALLTPRPIADSEILHQRILEQAPERHQSAAAVKAADAAARYASLDRLPDPSIGVFTAREAFDGEEIIGVSISMPLPGGQRRQQARARYAEADMAKADHALMQRQLESAAFSLVAQAQGDYRRWLLAEKAARDIQDNTRLVQRAYTLGEHDLQYLLLAQQQHLRAARHEVDLRTQALRSAYAIEIATGTLDGI